MDIANRSGNNVRAYRLSSIDFLRGVVILIMAIDHVRDFFYVNNIQDPMADPNVSVALYLTRWITHFCAPVFVFLAGTSAGLMTERKSQTELSKFLLTRGLWLIFIEFVVISTAVTFAPFGEMMMGGKILVAMQVIWAIGASMIILALVSFLGQKFCLLAGVLIVVFGNLLGPIWPAGNLFAGTDPIWVTLYVPASFGIGIFHFASLYPLIPWLGVMLLGFGATFIFKKEPINRDHYLRITGLFLIALFLILRLVDVYGEPNSWQKHDSNFAATVFDFMNVSKYPPSLMFFLATLGPMAILCSYADRWNGKVKDIFVMFGRVPFMFYILHFYLIHALSVVAGVMQGFETHLFFHFFPFYPEGYGISLPAVYGVWIMVCFILYWPCKWMAGLKARRKDWWLSYL